MSFGDRDGLKKSIQVEFWGSHLKKVNSEKSEFRLSFGSRDGMEMGWTSQHHHKALGFRSVLVYKTKIKTTFKKATTGAPL